jgi:transglutaminase-like putative cysteine protease
MGLSKDRGRHVKWISCSLLIALMPFGQPHAAAGQYDIVPVPAWVDVLSSAPNEQRDTQANGGTEFLLTDVQERLGKVASRYHHYVSRVLNTAGVEENAQIGVTFDPKLEKLHLHAVQVRRAGKVIDELKLGRIRVLQQEDELEENLVNGALTFHLLLTDLRVGDVIDYSYSIDRQELAWKDKHSGRIETQWTTPGGRTRSRISLPTNSALFYRVHPESAPKVWERDGYKFYEWDQKNTPAVVFESQAPGWFQQFGAIEYSQFADWAEVVRTAQPLFDVSPVQSGEMQQLVGQFKKTSEDPQARIIAAVRFVQDEIRYTGIEEGIGAYRPTAPREVLARRFGDCKDKTLLAVTLLRGMGIEAVPALVSTHWRSETRNRLPSPYAMNHAIVRIDLAGKIYWFDVTATGQGGNLDTVWQAHFGWALPIDSGVTDLQAMPEAALSEPLKVVSTTVDLRNGKDKPAQMQVTTVYSRHEADSMRHRLRSDGNEALAKKYLDYYQDQFDGVTSSAPLKVTDDRSLNRLSVEEFYSVQKVFKKTEHGPSKFYLEPDAVLSYLKTPDLKRRTTPFAQQFPIYVTEEFEVLFPDDWSMSTGKQQVHGGAFEYSSDVSYADHTLKTRFEFKSLSDHVEEKDFPEFLTTLKKARDDAGYAVSDLVDDAPAKVQAAKLQQTEVFLMPNGVPAARLIMLCGALIAVIYGLVRVRAGRAR